MQCTPRCRSTLTNSVLVPRDVLGTGCGRGAGGHTTAVGEVQVCRCADCWPVGQVAGLQTRPLLLGTSELV
jgi:hypothetical protein